MKLLIVTQVVDKSHPILGFFHRWIEEFAKHFDEVHVICLQKGVHTLPANVFVYSLGKEKGLGKLSYTLNFYKYIWMLRKQYDSVFVHMNQIYILLGGILWKLQRKKVGLWYTHGSVSASLRIAEKLTNLVFTGSPDSFRLHSKKVVVTGHGIDTQRFLPQKDVRKNIDLITVGRISKSKNIVELIDVLIEVRKIKDISLTIVGRPLSSEDMHYEKTIKRYAQKRGVYNAVHFIGAVSNEQLPTLLNSARVFVHAATNGSLDKALLEPLAVGLPVVSSGMGAQSLPLHDWQVKTVSSFAEKIGEILETDVSKQCHLLRRYVIENHSILSLIPKIRLQYE